MLFCHSRYPNLKTYFEYELKSVDTTTSVASFKLSSKDFFSPKPESVEVKYDLLVGADGVNSTVRSQMIQLDKSETSSPQKYDLRRFSVLQINHSFGIFVKFMSIKANLNA